jgi:hypothetical protein
VPQADNEVQMYNNIIINIRCEDKDKIEAEGFATNLKFTTKSKYHTP